ncbi:MAG TPA: GntR family transcriptional regulator [Nocardioides sp.]|jgi:DNA-binding GntR family transcriptional regulator|uniref:GntR family transcriptional regulator n=1 Tax=Nocardioides sp. TaxID=35761 RepID=UPI002E370765|nr:GntR family transcriptional regulator [Nocardioides sp.]HEX3930526.1 GntR family transcriptional regulator [Nocardioides sp.]
MAANSSEVITRHHLNDQVAARIREEILSGALRPGTRMVQSDWAARLGTSRMPVRDALLRLQSEGLITAFENGIAHVADLSEEDIVDAYTLSSMAAGIAAQRAAERMAPERVDHLAALHQEFAAAVERDDVDAATLANNAFHRLLTVESRSPRLIGMMRVLSAGTPHVGTRELPSWRRRSVISHELILAAVVAHDGDLVAKLMSEHVLEAAEVVSGYLRSRGFWSVDGAP